MDSRELARKNRVLSRRRSILDNSAFKDGNNVKKMSPKGKQLKKRDSGDHMKYPDRASNLRGPLAPKDYKPAGSIEINGERYVAADPWADQRDEANAYFEKLRAENVAARNKGKGKGKQHLIPPDPRASEVSVASTPAPPSENAGSTYYPPGLMYGNQQYTGASGLTYKINDGILNVDEKAMDHAMATEGNIPQDQPALQAQQPENRDSTASWCTQDYWCPAVRSAYLEGLPGDEASKNEMPVDEPSNEGNNATTPSNESIEKSEIAGASNIDQNTREEEPQQNEDKDRPSDAIDAGNTDATNTHPQKLDAWDALDLARRTSVKSMDTWHQFVREKCEGEAGNNDGFAPQDTQAWDTKAWEWSTKWDCWVRPKWYNAHIAYRNRMDIITGHAQVSRRKLTEWVGDVLRQCAECRLVQVRYTERAIKEQARFLARTMESFVDQTKKIYQGKESLAPPPPRDYMLKTELGYFDKGKGKEGKKGKASRDSRATICTITPGPVSEDAAVGASLSTLHFLANTLIEDLQEIVMQAKEAEEATNYPEDAGVTIHPAHLEEYLDGWVVAVTKFLRDERERHDEESESGLRKIDENEELAEEAPWNLKLAKRVEDWRQQTRYERTEARTEIVRQMREQQKEKDSRFKKALVEVIREDRDMKAASAQEEQDKMAQRFEKDFADISEHNAAKHDELLRCYKKIEILEQQLRESNAERDEMAKQARCTVNAIKNSDLLLDEQSHRADSTIVRNPVPAKAKDAKEMMRAKFITKGQDEGMEGNTIVAHSVVPSPAHKKRRSSNSAGMDAAEEQSEHSELQAKILDYGPKPYGDSPRDYRYSPPAALTQATRDEKIIEALEDARRIFGNTKWGMPTATNVATVPAAEAMRVFEDPEHSELLKLRDLHCRLTSEDHAVMEAERAKMLCEYRLKKELEYARNIGASATIQGSVPKGHLSAEPYQSGRDTLNESQIDLEPAHLDTSRLRINTQTLGADKSPEGRTSTSIGVFQSGRSGLPSINLPNIQDSAARQDTNQKMQYQ